MLNDAVIGQRPTIYNSIKLHFACPSYITIIVVSAITIRILGLCVSLGQFASSPTIIDTAIENGAKNWTMIAAAAFFNPIFIMAIFAIPITIAVWFIFTYGAAHELSRELFVVVASDGFTYEKPFGGICYVRFSDVESISADTSTWRAAIGACCVYAITAEGPNKKRTTYKINCGLGEMQTTIVETLLEYKNVHDRRGGAGKKLAYQAAVRYVKNPSGPDQPVSVPPEDCEWQCVTVDRKNVAMLFGVRISKYEWYETGESIQVRDWDKGYLLNFPIYTTDFTKRHGMGFSDPPSDRNEPYIFAAGEFVNGSWGFYVPQRKTTVKE